MANTMKALQTYTVGAGGVASVSFTNIPQTYTDLVVKISARTTDANNYQSMYMTVNAGAQGSVLSQKWINGDGSAVASSGYSSIGQIYPFYINGSSSTSNTFNNGEIYITNYASTTTNKSMSTDGVTENNATAARAELDAISFASNSAITSLLFGPGAGNFVANSTFTLYGVFNADVSTAPSAPNIGTASDGGTGTTASITFTGVANAASYTMTSSPGGITATGTTSPITVSGLTTGTPYTFTCTASNPFGTSAASSASNSVTPAVPPAYESIASVTSGSSSISFNSIPSTYKHLQIRILGRTTDTGSGGVDRMGLRFNGSSSSIYTNHYIAGSGTAASAGGNAAISEIRIFGVLQGGGTTPNCFASGIIDIQNYADTTQNKTIKYLGAGDSDGTGTYYIGSGFSESTSAVSSITLLIGSTGARTLASGSIVALYGIKG